MNSKLLTAIVGGLFALALCWRATVIDYADGHVTEYSIINWSVFAAGGAGELEESDVRLQEYPVHKGNGMTLQHDPVPDNNKPARPGGGSARPRFVLSRRAHVSPDE